jgi:ABC-type uncharacterized transport system permease subunit
MTPAEAARILGVAPDASKLDVERAYRVRARESHPDRRGGANAEAIAAATAEFARVGEAFAVLSAPRVVMTLASVPPFSRPVIAGWFAVLALATALLVTGGAAPFGTLELIARVGVLVSCAVGYSVTGRSGFFVIGVAAFVVTAAFTAVAASFGSLLALFVVVPAVIALAVTGRRRAALRQRERS